MNPPKPYLFFYEVSPDYSTWKKMSLSSESRISLMGLQKFILNATNDYYSLDHYYSLG